MYVYVHICYICLFCYWYLLIVNQILHNIDTDIRQLYWLENLESLVLSMNNFKSFQNSWVFAARFISYFLVSTLGRECFSFL